MKNHFKETIKLSIPVIIGHVGLMLMGVVDSIMVGSLSASALAAVAIGHNLFILIFILGIGIANALTPLVAIEVGAGRKENADFLFTQQFYVNSITALILLVITYFASNLIALLDQPIEIVPNAIAYTKILGVSIIPSMIYLSYKQFLEGFSDMFPAMYVVLSANIVNFIFNYLLIYGEFGFPRLEVLGAGWATFFSRVYMAIAIFIIVSIRKKYKSFAFHILPLKIDFPKIKKILRLGIPSGFQSFFEIGAFSFAAVMVGWIGKNALAAHQIALNVASITYMVVLGFSVASSIRVGNFVGAKDVSQTRRAGFSAILLGISAMIFFALVIIIFNSLIPTFYVKELDVISIASKLLIIAAMFQIFDGTQAVALGSLRGLTDVKIPTLLTFTSYWVISLPSAYLLAFKFNYGVEGIWFGLLIGLAVTAVLLTFRFHIRSKAIFS